MACKTDSVLLSWSFCGQRHFREQELVRREALEEHAENASAEEVGGEAREGEEESGPRFLHTESVNRFSFGKLATSGWWIIGTGHLRNVRGSSARKRRRAWSCATVSKRKHRKRCMEGVFEGKVASSSEARARRLRSSPGAEGDPFAACTGHRATVL